MMKYPNFIGGSYRAQAITASQEMTINWYPERIEAPGGTSKMVLNPAPGFATLGSVPVGPGRAHIWAEDREFAVIGPALYEIDVAGALTSRGTVSADHNPATISYNGKGAGELFITSATLGFIYDLTANTLTQVTALNGKATQGAHSDGYFICLDSAASTFYISSLTDRTSWTTGVDFAQRAKSDPWVAMKVLGSYLLLLGEETSDLWWDAGTSSFPFAPHPSGTIHYGCRAPFSLCISGKSAYWVGTQASGGTACIGLTGFAPEVMSDYPHQTQLGVYDAVSDAVGDVYTDCGHTFYLPSFPTENVTWAFDAETRVWTQRDTWLSSSATSVAMRPRWHAFAFGQHRWLDSSTGGVYRMSNDLCTDVDGLPLRRLRRAPAISEEGQRIYYPGFELAVETGLGHSSGVDENPLISMRMSDDFGRTWGNPRTRSLGKIGEFSKRLQWKPCGSAIGRVFEVTTTATTPVRITDAYLPGVHRGDREQPKTQVQA